MTGFPSRTPPLVSVAMVTYNHERFITQAIESVLAQRTSFPSSWWSATMPPPTVPPGTSRRYKLARRMWCVRSFGRPTSG